MHWERTWCREKKIKDRRKRQRMKWLDSITSSMDMNLSKLRETVEDRGAWRAAVHGVAKGQRQFSNWTTAVIGADYNSRFVGVGLETSLNGVRADSGNLIGFLGLHFEYLWWSFRVVHKVTDMKIVHTQVVMVISLLFPRLIRSCYWKECCVWVPAAHRSKANK